MANRKKVEEAGSAVFNKFFSSQDAQNVSDETEAPAVSNPSTSTKKRSEKAQKSVKKVFSFRGEEESVKAWRVYADAAGMKVDDLGSLALQEYIEKHPLTGDQKKIFDLKMKA